MWLDGPSAGLRSMCTSQIPSLPAQWAGGKTRPLIGSSCWIVNCRSAMCWQRLFNIWCQWKPHDQLNRKCVTPLLNPPSLAPPPLPPPSLCHRFHRLIFTEPGGTLNPRWVSFTSVCQQIKAWFSSFYRPFFQALFRFSPAAALTAHWPTGEVPLDEMELNITDTLYELQADIQEMFCQYGSCDKGPSLGFLVPVSSWAKNESFSHCLVMMH